MLWWRLGFCMSVLTFCLYSYQKKQNEVTQLKIQIPQIEKEIASLRAENRKLNYEIDQIENPVRLIELAHTAEYRHLKHPLLKEIKEVPEAIVMNH
jgi:cell division protein FtsB